MFVCMYVSAHVRVSARAIRVGHVGSQTTPRDTPAALTSYVANRLMHEGQSGPSLKPVGTLTQAREGQLHLRPVFKSSFGRLVFSVTMRKRHWAMVNMARSYTCHRGACGINVQVVYYRLNRLTYDKERG